MRNKNSIFKLIFAKQTLTAKSASTDDSLENDVGLMVEVKAKEK